jgi:DNA mismatch endonuclease (patch repair protein)
VRWNATQIYLFNVASRLYTKVDRVDGAQFIVCFSGKYALVPETSECYMKPPKSSKKIDKAKRSHSLVFLSSRSRRRSPARPRSKTGAVAATQLAMRRFKKVATEPERIVRTILSGLGVRFRVNDPHLPGTPDIVVPDNRKIILVNGCFWHQHGCPLTRFPNGNFEYWTPKFNRNRARDRRVRRQLSAMRWKTIVVWECQTKKKSLVARLERFIKS